MIKEQDKEKTRIHVYVSGRVQGVFFRKTTLKMAQRLMVFGWVKNLTNGQVETILEGEKKNVEQMINWLKKGPFLAQVKNIIFNQEDYQGEFKKFEIR
jgi:acylphosphatase